jgi:hypothetical protein
MFREAGSGLRVCMIPNTVTHRLYWHRAKPESAISAFLSYPNAMGFGGEGKYFWETYGTTPEDVERFFGDGAEEEMEAAIVCALSSGITVTAALETTRKIRAIEV